MRKLCFAAGALAIALPAAALAQKAEPPRSAALKRLTDCRSLANGAERLACYDREVAAVDAAEASRALVVVDREQLRRTRRTLFGLTLPDLAVFGDDNEDEEKITSLESTIRSASQGGYGKWVLTLEDGARWVQTDSRDLPVDPRPGHKIRIRRGAIGSYLANINDQVAIRVRRER